MINLSYLNNSNSLWSFGKWLNESKKIAICRLNCFRKIYKNAIVISIYQLMSNCNKLDHSPKIMLIGRLYEIHEARIFVVFQNLA